MSREELFLAVGQIRGCFVAEAVRYDPEMAAGASERSIPMKSKRIVTLALAAALILALGATAFAVFSSFSYRIPDADETFRIHYPEAAGNYAEWSNAKLVVTFPEIEESREIQFRTTWLPEEMSALSRENWRGVFTAEERVLGRVPAYEGMYQPLQINCYAVSQFTRGGALLLLYQTPGEIREEHWDEQNVDVLLFSADSSYRGRDGEIQVQTTHYVLMMNTEAGWVIKVAGQISQEEIVKVARSLEIRETGKLLRYEDFENHYQFFDNGIG